MNNERAAHVEVQCAQDKQLHGANGCHGAALVRNVFEVVDFRRVYFLVFCRDEHACYAKQLQLGFRNNFVLQNAELS